MRSFPWARRICQALVTMSAVSCPLHQAKALRFHHLPSPLHWPLWASLRPFVKSNSRISVRSMSSQPHLYGWDLAETSGIQTGRDVTIRSYSQLGADDYSLPVGFGFCRLQTSYWNLLWQMAEASIRCRWLVAAEYTGIYRKLLLRNVVYIGSTSRPFLNSIINSNSQTTITSYQPTFQSKLFNTTHQDACRYHCHCSLRDCCRRSPFQAQGGCLGQQLHRPQDIWPQPQHPIRLLQHPDPNRVLLRGSEPHAALSCHPVLWRQHLLLPAGLCPGRRCRVWSRVPPPIPRWVSFVEIQYYKKKKWKTLKLTLF